MQTYRPTRDIFRERGISSEKKAFRVNSEEVLFASDATLFPLKLIGRSEASARVQVLVLAAKTLCFYRASDCASVESKLFLTRTSEVGDLYPKLQKGEHGCSLQVVSPCLMWATLRERCVMSRALPPDMYAQFISRV